MQGFQDWTDAHNLLHLPTRGAHYTWSNGRRGRRHTQRRLDRSICNQEWLDLCGTTSCSAIIKNRSDHYPLLLEFKTFEGSLSSNFKFLQMWAKHENCRDFIAACWQERVVGCPMLLLKDNLCTWNLEIFGNIHSHVKEAEDKLQSIQHQINSSNPTDDLLNQEKHAQCDFDKVLERQECFWREQNKTKLITTMRVEENILSDPQEISNHVVSYFQFFFFALMLFCRIRS